MLCMFIGSLFSFGALNNYGKTDIELIDSSKAINGMNNNHASYISEANAKSKIKRGNLLSVRGKCSCSLLTDYKMHRAKWLNYCPQCHKYGTLRFTRGGGCPEGMLYCTRCDADFCVVHGKEHVYGGAKYLRSA